MRCPVLKYLLTLCLCVTLAFVLPHCAKEGKLPASALQHRNTATQSVTPHSLRLTTYGTR